MELLTLKYKPNMEKKLDRILAHTYIDMSLVTLKAHNLWSFKNKKNILNRRNRYIT